MFPSARVTLFNIYMYTHTHIGTQTRIRRETLMKHLQPFNSFPQRRKSPIRTGTDTLAFRLQVENFHFWKTRKTRTAQKRFHQKSSHTRTFLHLLGTTFFLAVPYPLLSFGQICPQTNDIRVGKRMKWVHFRKFRVHFSQFSFSPLHQGNGDIDVCVCPFQPNVLRLSDLDFIYELESQNKTQSTKLWIFVRLLRHTARPNFDWLNFLVVCVSILADQFLKNFSRRNQFCVCFSFVEFCREKVHFFKVAITPDFSKRAFDQWKRTIGWLMRKRRVGGKSNRFLCAFSSNKMNVGEIGKWFHVFWAYFRKSATINGGTEGKLEAWTRRSHKFVWIEKERARVLQPPSIQMIPMKGGEGGDDGETAWWNLCVCVCVSKWLQRRINGKLWKARLEILLWMCRLLMVD